MLPKAADKGKKIKKQSNIKVYYRKCLQNGNKLDIINVRVADEHIDGYKNCVEPCLITTHNNI